MHVVHAVWLPDERTLRLWGESSESLAARTGDLDGDALDDDHSRGSRHPFASPSASLEAFCARCGLAEAPRPDPELVVALPSCAGAPTPSPELSAEGAEPDEVELFRVPSIALAPAEAALLLRSLDDGGGLKASRSLRHLAVVETWARSLVAAGAVVPMLEGGVLRWAPVAHVADDRARGLWERLPPSARAGLAVEELAEAAGEGAEHVDPRFASARDVVTSLLRALVDSTCATALVERGYLQRSLPSLRPAIQALTEEAEASFLGGAQRERWRSWTAPVERASQPARLLFRLAPPTEETEETDKTRARAGTTEPAWRVEVLLQSQEDPSLLVEPARVFTEEVVPGLGTAPTLRELWLADVGRALRVFPELEGAMSRAAGPAGIGQLVLDTPDAWTFLKVRAPLLREAGFGVVVPAWWGQPSRRLGVRVKASSAQRATASGVALFAYDLSIALGDETLTADELRALAAAKTPLVKSRGKWVELDPADVERALSLLHERGPGTLTGLELLRLGAGLSEVTGDLPVVSVEAREGPSGARDDAWAQLLGGDAALAPVSPPSSFQGALRPYQGRGLGWLSFLEDLGLGACLADDMGLGKTVQLLALLEAERARRPPSTDAPPSGAEARGTLLLCPLSVVENWRAEAGRFTPRLDVHVHHGPSRLRGAELAARLDEADLTLTTYALLARDRAAFERRWRRVVLDEAQHIKNPGAQQTQAVNALLADRRIALTGTPVENRLAELWSIFRFLNPGLLGSEAAFTRHFARPIERNGDAGRAEELRRLTGPLLLRRVKTDRRIIDDLPDKLEVKERCLLSREQASLYEAVANEMLADVEEAEGIERRGKILAGLLRLKQICDHPALYLGDGSRLPGRSPKLARLDELLAAALDAGERTLVFTQFATMGSLLAGYLEERFLRPVGFLHGGTSKARRDRLVAHFQSDDGPFALLVSLKAGGTGLNLTRASRVVHFDRWWNPAVEDQATDRAFRIGQKQRVLVHKMVTQGTVEERIDEMIEKKRALAGQVVGSGEGWLTELDTSTLRDMLKLSAAVGEE